VIDTGTQTRAGKWQGYGRVRVRVHKVVPVDLPVPPATGCRVSAHNLSHLVTCLNSHSRNERKLVFEGFWPCQQDQLDTNNSREGTKGGTQFFSLSCCILILFCRTSTQRGGVCLLVGSLSLFRPNDNLPTQRRPSEEVHTSSLGRCSFLDPTTTEVHKQWGGRTRCARCYFNFDFSNQALQRQRRGGEILLVIV